MRTYTAQAYADRNAAMSLEVAGAAPVQRDSLDSEHWEVVTDARGQDFSPEGLAGAAAVDELIEGGTARVVAEPAEGMTPIEGAPASGSPRYVINRSTGRAHRLRADWAPTQPSCGWRAACGWAFSGADVLMVVARPQRPWCTQKGCFKGVPAPADDNESDGSGG